MADDLSLLLHIRRGDTSGTTAIADMRQGLQTLTGTLNTLSQTSLVAESSLGSLTNGFTSASKEASELASVIGPGGVLAGGLLIIATGAVAAGEAIFELSKKTAEYGESMQKAAISTGLSQEALGGLKVIAEETHSSFESLTTTAARMETMIGRGLSNPASEAGKALQSLGLQTETFKKALPDQQLQQVAKGLTELTNQSDKNRAAQALLSRGWIQSAEAIHRIAEGFDEAEKKADAFGLVMTEEDIKAAEEFNKAVGDLWLEFQGFGLAVGTKILPQVEDAIKDLNSAIFGTTDALGNQKSAWDDWADFAVKAVGSVRVVVSGLMAFMNDAAGIGFVNPLTAMQQKAEQVADVMAGPATGGDLGTLSFGRRRLGATGGGGGRSAAVEKLSAAQKLLNQLTDEYNKLLIKAGDLTDFDVLVMKLQEKQYAKTTEAEKDQILAQQRLIDNEKEIIKDKKDSAEFDKEINKQAAEDAKVLIDQLRTRAEARASIEERITGAIQQQYEALSQLKGFEKSHLQIVEEFIAEQVKQAEAVGGVTDKMKELFAWLTKIGAQLDQIEAKNKLFAGVTGGAEGGSTLKTGSSIQSLFQGINDNFTGNKQTAALAGLGAITEAFQGLGQAVGQVVQAWVLYGNAGTSVRKVTAEILAGVAQQAAVKAVFELAEGFAALALAFFGLPNAGPSASAHFAAAAIYGGIAGVAAVAGRGVAGTAFAQKGASTGSAGSSAGTSSAGSSSSGNQPIVLGSQRVEVIHKIVPPPGWGHTAIVSAFNSNDPKINRVINRDRG